MFRIRLFPCLATICLLAGLAAAQPPEPGKAPDPQMQAMMESWMKYASTGPQHRLLAERAGKWDAAVKFWMAPGAPADESKSTSECTLIMGGRYLGEKLDGGANGMPFSGMGITGYDNLKKKFVGIWVDNMSTGIMASESVGDSDGKVISYVCEMPDPVSGKYKKCRAVETTVDANTRKMESYDIGPDGKEFKSMEIVYTRK